MIALWRNPPQGLFPSEQVNTPHDESRYYQEGQGGVEGVPILEFQVQDAIIEAEEDQAPGEGCPECPHGAAGIVLPGFFF